MRYWLLFLLLLSPSAFAGLVQKSHHFDCADALVFVFTNYSNDKTFFVTNGCSIINDDGTKCLDGFGVIPYSETYGQCQALSRSFTAVNTNTEKCNTAMDGNPDIPVDNSKSCVFIPDNECVAGAVLVSGAHYTNNSYAPGTTGAITSAVCKCGSGTYESADGNSCIPNGQDDPSNPNPGNPDKGGGSCDSSTGVGCATSARQDAQTNLLIQASDSLAKADDTLNFIKDGIDSIKNAIQSGVNSIVSAVNGIQTSGGGAGTTQAVTSLQDSLVGDGSLPVVPTEEQLNNAMGITAKNTTIPTNTIDVAHDFTGTYFSDDVGSLPDISFYIPRMGTFVIHLSDFSDAFLVIRYLVIISCLLRSFRMVYLAAAS